MQRSSSDTFTGWCIKLTGMICRLMILTLEDHLMNWARFARSSSSSCVSILGQLYGSNPYEDENGELIARAQPPRIPIDLQDAMKTEKAILRLPKTPYNAPRLIVYHYITPWKDIHRECRKIGVKVYKYQVSLEESLRLLSSELTSP